MDTKNRLWGRLGNSEGGGAQSWHHNHYDSKGGLVLLVEFSNTYSLHIAKRIRAYTIHKFSPLISYLHFATAKSGKTFKQGKHLNTKHVPADPVSFLDPCSKPGLL